MSIKKEGEKIAITKIAAALFVVGLIVGVAAGYGISFTIYQPQISDLQSQVSELEGAGNELLQKDTWEQYITADMLMGLIDDNGDGTPYGTGDDLSNDPLIIDLREYVDYSDGHVLGAAWIAFYHDMATPESLDELDELLQEHMAETENDLIVVYCYSGRTAGLTTGVLGSLGYNVRNLSDGYNEGWLPSGYPIET